MCKSSLVGVVKTISTFLLWAECAAATPTVTFPINSQVPPVARVNSLFNFTFSSSTFTSSLALTYNLSNAPTWLSLDGSQRRLYGTPTASDADSAPVVEITASDSSGSVAMNTTLVVSSNPAPKIQIPLEKQLHNFGNYSAPSSILFYPSAPFNVTFDPNTFSNTNLNHYAVTLDNTPLPSWVEFDGSTLSFTGTTPDSASLIQPPQLFGIQLIASDVLGFAGVSLPFHVVVGNHELAFEEPFLTINATAGKAMNQTSFLSTLLLDGNVANSSTIKNATANTPSWITFDVNTLTLSGTVPANGTSYNISVEVSDIYGDLADTIVLVNVTNSIFASTLTSLNATIGSHFSHDFSSLLVDPSDIDLTADISPSTSWLTYDPSTFTLSGDVPSNASPSNIKISLQATSKSSGTSANEDLSLNFIRVASTSSTSTSSASPIATSTASSSGTSTPAALFAVSAKRGGLTRGQLAAAIAVPIIAAVAALSICLFCGFRRRRQAKSRSSTPEKSDISRPLTPRTRIARRGSAADDRLHAYKDANTDFSWVNAKRHTTMMRRSQTASNISGPLSSHMTDSDNSRIRSFSENALSQYQTDSWRSTQASSYPTLNSTDSSRITRNFSRKAGVTHLTRDESSDLPNVLRESTNSFNIGLPKPAKLSRNSIQQTPDFAYDSENIKLYRDSRRDSRRSTPNYLGGIPNLGRRLSGIGHGSRRSTSDSSLSSDRRYSRGLNIGYGSGSGTSGNYGSGGYGVLRDSSSWLTMQTGNTRQRPQSTMSAVTESTDVLYPGETHGKSIKLVPKSPVTITSSNFSNDNRYARPISRRAGSSPFFGGSTRSRGSSTANSRKGASRTDYQAPAVPSAEATNEGLERAILRGLRDVPEDSQSELPRDSLGISYGDVTEGTQQLKSFVSSYISPQFSDNDSRFRSADHSPGSSSQDDPRFEGGLPLHDSEFFDEQGRQSLLSPRDSRGTSIHYEYDESPELGEAVVERPSLVERPSFLKPFSSFSRDSLPSQGVQERYMAGPGKRPVSIDRQESERELKTQKSMTASHYEGFTGHDKDAGDIQNNGSAFL